MGSRGRKSAAELAIVRPVPAAPERAPEPGLLAPPRPLGEHGMALWQRITSDYEIEGGGNVELLLLACATLDRAEACRAAIDRDGEMIAAGNGSKEHPLLKTELGSRALIARLLQRLLEES